MNLNKFTQNSIHALERARDIAVEHQHQMIQPVYLCYGLLSDTDGLANGLLSKCSAQPSAMLSELNTQLQALPSVHGTTNVYFTNETETILNTAETLARNMQDDFVSVEHLLLSFFNCSDKAMQHNCG